MPVSARTGGRHIFVPNGPWNSAHRPISAPVLCGRELQRCRPGAV